MDKNFKKYLEFLECCAASLTDSLMSNHGEFIEEIVPPEPNLGMFYIIIKDGIVLREKVASEIGRSLADFPMFPKFKILTKYEFNSLSLDKKNFPAYT